MTILSEISAPTDLAVHSFTNLNQRQQTELRKIWLHSTTADAHAIGWLPVTAFDVRASNDHVLALYRNDDCVGWTMATPSRSRGVLKLYQIWVRPDARILEHGRALVAELLQRARQAHCHMTEAWVAEDLPANLFWAAIGFTRCTWRWGKGVNSRRHWLWIAHTPRILTV